MQSRDVFIRLSPPTTPPDGLLVHLILHSTVLMLFFGLPVMTRSL